MVLYAVFDEVSEHWMLFTAFYAAHHNADGDSDFYGLYNQFPYPDVDRGYPRVWVANDKHGSYRSKGACNDGGLANKDDCSYNYDDERVDVEPTRNLGSQQFQFLNCVYSENRYSYPGTECFWTSGYDFCGWDLDRTNCASDYAAVLDEFGFGIAF